MPRWKDEGLASSVLDALPDTTAVLDRDGTIVAVNHAWEMFAVDNGGSPASTGAGVNYLEVCARSAAAGCEVAAEVADGLRAVLSGATVQRDVEYPCPSPTAGRWFLLRITRLGDPSPGAVASHVNITRRKMAELALADEAAHDPLTGLANRVLFHARLASVLAPRADRPKEPDTGIVYLDLDGFKAVNDTFGHDAGDEVLIDVAHRLNDVVRSQDTVARLGGDEFALVVPRIAGDALDRLASRITSSLAAPHHVHGRTVSVPASVGVHRASPGDSVQSSLRQADGAMYAVKAARLAAGAAKR